MENQQKPIEYEAVTIRVPKLVMDYLRSMEKAYNMSAVEQIEHDFVDSVRAELESMTGSVLMEIWNLRPVFKTVLGEDCLG
jgi:hypothetical protein